MKKIVALEEFGQLAAAIFCLYQLPLSLHWGWWLAVFFSPDLGAMAYLVNRKAGAVCYNLLHHKLLAIVLIGYGLLTGPILMAAIGLLWFAHSSFDRILGYGLKYLDNPSHTHLGYIGKERFKNRA